MACGDDCIDLRAMVVYRDRHAFMGLAHNPRPKVISEIGPHLQKKTAKQEEFNMSGCTALEKGPAANQVLRDHVISEIQIVEVVFHLL